jgi:hypothetical protein
MDKKRLLKRVGSSLLWPAEVALTAGIVYATNEHYATPYDVPMGIVLAGSIPVGYTILDTITRGVFKTPLHRVKEIGNGVRDRFEEIELEEIESDIIPNSYYPADASHADYLKRVIEIK